MTDRVIIDLFTTLDWVAQAPGAPDEDTSGGHPRPSPSGCPRTCPTSPFAGELKGLSKASGRSQEPHSLAGFS